MLPLPIPEGPFKGITFCKILWQGCIDFKTTKIIVLVLCDFYT